MSSLSDGLRVALMDRETDLYIDMRSGTPVLELPYQGIKYPNDRYPTVESAKEAGATYEKYTFRKVRVVYTRVLT